MAEDDVYTKDGTIDIHKNPANKKKTGKWKACRFILGMFTLFLTFNFDCSLLKFVTMMFVKGMNAVKDWHIMG